MNSPACQKADVLIACGGGKALDTVKTAAIELKKIVFTVPTICSNCSAATAIAVVYNDDGSLEGYSYPNRPAHIFINPKIIAEAPAEYFWAGVGDALSKQPEVEHATSAGNLEHTAGLGLALAHTCSEPLFTYGVQGLEDVRQNLSSEAVKQIALDIVVNTGYVSNLTNQNDYYYNSSVAHAFYNATCSIPREGTYLHGEVVSLGVLVLFAYTGKTENLERYAAFNKQMGLPVTLEQVGLSESDIPACASTRMPPTSGSRATLSPSPTRSSPPPSRRRRLRPHALGLTQNHHKGDSHLCGGFLLLKYFGVELASRNHTVPVTQQQIDENAVARGERTAKGAVVDATRAARGAAVLQDARSNLGRAARLLAHVERTLSARRNSRSTDTPRRYGPRRSRSRTACAASEDRQKPRGTPTGPRFPCARKPRPAREGSCRARYTCSPRPSNRHSPRSSYISLPSKTPHLR